ncbi:MAG: RnfH family protein [Gammaproteobacteria bacterium]|nr:RnfH family protein [Gammaproteobacteria bacterium]
MNKINIEVAYAKADTQRIIKLEVACGTTIEAAIQQSGILAFYPEIDLAQQKVGIFSQKRELTDLVQAGERIEIYRPLIIDPKEARRAKAKKNKKK